MVQRIRPRGNKSLLHTIPWINLIAIIFNGRWKLMMNMTVVMVVTMSSCMGNQHFPANVNSENSSGSSSKWPGMANQTMKNKKEKDKS